MTRAQILIAVGLTLLAADTGVARVRPIPHPFDNRRRGFVLGVSAGPALTYINSRNDVNPAAIAKATMAFELLLGFGVTDRHLIYLYHRAAIYPDEMVEDYDHYFSKLNTSTDEGRLRWMGAPFAAIFIPFFTEQHAAVGVGMRIYQRPRIPSLYFDFGIGPSAPWDPWEKSDPHHIPGSIKAGPGISLGAGYEFSRHFAVSLQSIWARGKAEKVSWPDPFTRIVDVSTTWYAVSWKLQLDILGY